LYLEEKRAVHGPLLPSLFSEAKELAAVVCTIGHQLEREVADYFNRDKALQGLVLDGIGSAAVDSLIEKVCKLMTAEALSHGYQASSPISPGMPGFPITEQWQLIKMVPVQEIGVSLTSSGVMVPRKSASMVIGIGPHMRRWTRAEVCTRCHLKKTCPYRIGT
jgi:cobalamin-dependent methionine synthase I